MRSHFRTATAAGVAFGCALTAFAALAGRITLNDTGMTQCIDRQGDWSEDCARSRQDADYGRDVDDSDPNDGVAGFSFQKVCRSGEMAGQGSCPADPNLGSGPDDWGCVYDNVTQLTWETKTTDGGIHDYLRHYTNKGKKARDDSADAAWLIEATDDEALCGATNWRLPDVLELQSIIDYGGGSPLKAGIFLDPTFFPYDTFGGAWTKVERVDEPKQAWYIHINGGDTGTKQRFDTSAYARLVHRATSLISSAQLSNDRFVPSPDGTEVKDTLTGLVWARCSEGMAWNNGTQTCDGTDERFDRKEALSYIKGQKGGWRIPNIKELLSISDLTAMLPAVDRIAFPNTPTTQYVLSSTYADAIGHLHVKIVDFSVGAVREVATDRGDRWSLRLVRRGRE